MKFSSPRLQIVPLLLTTIMVALVKLSAADEQTKSSQPAALADVVEAMETHADPHLETLIQRLGSESYAERRHAFAEIWQLGSLAEARINQAAQSSDKQVAESARRLRLLIKVGAHAEDIQTARELAELFLEPTDQNLIEIASRGYWQLAVAFMDEHHAYAIRAQESFFQQASSRYLVQRLVQLAQTQGNIDLAWPVIARLIPEELAAWTAAKLQMPLPRPAADEHEQAVRLFLAGQIQESLKLNISPQLKLRLATRGFQWNRLADDSVQQALLGQDRSQGHLAAQAVLLEFAGDRNQSSQLWREALELPAVDGETALDDDEQSLAAKNALISAVSSADDMSSANQLMLALLVSGRVAAIEQYFIETSPLTAFEFLMVSSDFQRAFEQVGLEPGLTNFDDWLKEQSEDARNALAEFNGSAGQDVRSLNPAIILGHVGSMLVGMGYREQSMRILEELVRLGQRDSRRPNPVWEKCILRWIGRDEWRACCIDALNSHFERLPRKQRPLIFSKLYSELDSNAFSLFQVAPAIQEGINPESRRLALKQLDHLERCDRDYFGSDARRIVKDWLWRASGKLDAKADDEGDAQGDLSGLTKLANDWGLTDWGLQLLQIDSGQQLDSYKLYHQAAQICLQAQQAQTALQYLDIASPSFQDQHRDASTRFKSHLLLGQLDRAQQVQRAHWMQLTAVSWNGDRSAGYRATDDLTSERLWEEALPYAERNFAVDRFLNYYFGFWEARQYSRILQELKQYEKSADVMRAVFVELLKPFSQTLRVFIENEELGLLRYTVVRERVSRAIALVDAGDFQSARHELNVAFLLQPLDIEAVVAVYPAMIKSGQSELAEELFQQYESAMLAHLELWPRDAMNCNNLAWMYSQCDRQLDQAVTLARQAVELAPSSAVYLDTQAEVHFRLGKLDQAIDMMRGCVRLSPRDPHYRKNLERFCAAYRLK